MSRHPNSVESGKGIAQTVARMRKEQSVLAERPSELEQARSKRFVKGRARVAEHVHERLLLGGDPLNSLGLKTDDCRTLFSKELVESVEDLVDGHDSTLSIKPFAMLWERLAKAFRRLAISVASNVDEATASSLARAEIVTLTPLSVELAGVAAGPP